MSQRICTETSSGYITFFNIYKSKNSHVSQVLRSTKGLVSHSRKCRQRKIFSCSGSLEDFMDHGAVQHLLWAAVETLHDRKEKKKKQENWRETFNIKHNTGTDINCVFTLNISPSTACLIQRMELEMLVPERRLSGSKTRKPCSLSTTRDPPPERPSRCTTSPQQTGVISLEIPKEWPFYTVMRQRTHKHVNCKGTRTMTDNSVRPPLIWALWIKVWRIPRWK